MMVSDRREDAFESTIGHRLLALADGCRNVSAQFEGLTDTVPSGICRLGEYRSGLIPAAVTGENDVRAEVAE